MSVGARENRTAVERKRPDLELRFSIWAVYQSQEDFQSIDAHVTPADQLNQNLGVRARYLCFKALQVIAVFAKDENPSSRAEARGKPQSLVTHWIGEAEEGAENAPRGQFHER